VSTLSELLMQSLPEGWSARRVAREAQQQGLTLKESTATAYFGSRHGKPSEPVLSALAQVLGVPIEKLRTAAGLPAGEHLPYTPPVEAARLSQRQRAAIDELIRAVVGAVQTSRTDEVPQAPINPGPTIRVGQQDVAARLDDVSSDSGGKRPRGGKKSG